MTRIWRCKLQHANALSKAPAHISQQTFLTYASRSSWSLGSELAITHEHLAFSSLELYLLEFKLEQLRKLPPPVVQILGAGRRMKSAHRLPTQRQLAISEIPTEDVYTSCLCNKAAEKSSRLVPQPLLMGLNRQIRGSNVSSGTNQFHKRLFNHSLSCHMSANTRHQDNLPHEDSSLSLLLETSPLPPASHYKSWDCSCLWKGEELYHLTNVHTLPWKYYYKRPSTEGQKPPSTNCSTTRWGKTLHPKRTAQPWWPWQNSKTCLIHKTKVIKKIRHSPSLPKDNTAWGCCRNSKEGVHLNYTLK